MRLLGRPWAGDGVSSNSAVASDTLCALLQLGFGVLRDSRPSLRDRVLRFLAEASRNRCKRQPRTGGDIPRGSRALPRPLGFRVIGHALGHKISSRSSLKQPRSLIFMKKMLGIAILISFQFFRMILGVFLAQRHE